NDVLLIGNKVSINGGHINGKHNDNVSGDALKKPSGNSANKVHLVGNEVYIDKDMAKFKTTSGKVDVTANAIYTQRQMIKFAEDDYSFGDNVKVNVVNYKDSSGATHTGSSNFKKALTIGNMGNEKDNAIEWWHFAKGWNEGLGNIREIDEFRLVDDIDFSGNQGKGVEGKDWQNYANYWVDLNGDGKKDANEFTNMIVGHNNSFTKTFDGQGFTLKNINIDTTRLDNKPMYVGIFGSAENATFKNINVDYMDGSIIATTENGEVGGFIGSSRWGNFYNISIKKINEINNSNTGHFSATSGGFAGILRDSIVYDVSLNDIGSIKSEGSVGGFAGSILTENYMHSGILISNVSINDIGNIEGKISAGGFASSVDGPSHIFNISLKNIESIKVVNDGSLYIPSDGHISAGGFIGIHSSYNIGGGIFSNIYLENIGTISAVNTNYANHKAYSGGFVGLIEGDNRFNAKFENIYIYFNKDIMINSDNEIGKFFGNLTDDRYASFNNIHIYHHKNDLANATADQSYWGNTNDKIQIHTYNDNNQESVYKDFLSKTSTIEKPNHSDASLEQDDLNKEVITQIIEDITQKGYVVDIAKLEELLEVYSKFNLNTTEGEKIAFIQRYFNIKDENEARGILQSLDFLTYYTKNETFDKNRISNEAKDLFISLQNQSKTTLDNNEALFSYLNDNKDKLIAEYNKYKELEQIFKDKEQDYFKAQAEFNRLLDLVNKGKLSYNDPKFTQAFDNWLNAYNSYSNAYVDAKNINDNIKSTYTKYINETLGYDNFNFNPFLLSLNPDVDKPEFPDIDNSQGGDLPDFEQTASLNLIGDETLDDEEETEEVDETSLLQKSKTCIVSDNYKTMNPCVVGGL
ncbi:YlbF family regulator, partial [Campylobacter sp. LMG 7929]|uniref:hypothetical protein n=1 Tax=Campylobacter sp. LMG 7929 TaxID=2735749 RepID=UPI00301C4E57|nr:YlbF family regulator [Campylobacter sp. LMG 7929]